MVLLRIPSVVRGVRVGRRGQGGVEMLLIIAVVIAFVAIVATAYLAGVKSLGSSASGLGEKASAALPTFARTVAGGL